jgi:hypothetical protein
MTDAPKVWRSIVVLGWVLVLSAGCDSGPDDGTPTTGGARQAQGGAAGSSGGGQQAGAGAGSAGQPEGGGAGSSIGGNAFGGTSTSGNSNGGSAGDFVAARCTPSPKAPQLSTNCMNYEFEGSGVPADGFPSVKSSPLTRALVAGTKTAFSVTHLGDPATIEVWVPRAHVARVCRSS